MGHQAFFIVAIAASVALAPCGAAADYVLTPTSAGVAAKTVAPGTSFSIDVSLAVAAPDVTWTPTLTVDFSQSGLHYLGHSWSSPYQTAGIDDQSNPTNLQTPLLVTADSYLLYGNPAAVDVYFENFLETGTFTTGKLLTLNLEVPLGFTAGPITIRALPLHFDGEPIVTAGASFVLNVTGPRIWSGAGGDSYISTTGNWSNGVPTANDPMVFGAGPTQKNPTNDGTTPLAAVGGITFDATGYNLGGTAKLTVNGAVTANASATISAPLELAGTGGSAVAASGATLTVSGSVSGTQGITKTGTGTVELTAASNSYTGNTVAAEGTLKVSAGIDSNGNWATTGDDTTVGSPAAGLNPAKVATLITDHIRQDTLTINAGSKVTISATGGSSSTSVVNVLNIANSSGTFNWSSFGGGIAPAATGGPVAGGATVPEPATWLLVIMAALTGLVAWRRRK